MDRGSIRAVASVLSSADQTVENHTKSRKAGRTVGKRRKLSGLRGKRRPMGGNTADVYGFGLMLSIGDISEDAPGMRRRQALEQLYGVFPRGTGQIAAQELLLRANSDWSEVQKRAAAGEAIRIWYSNQPDELCGFYWMMARLTQWGDYQGPVYAVQLPGWESDGKGNTRRMLSWGGDRPWRMVSLSGFAKACAPRTLPKLCRRLANSPGRECTPARHAEWKVNQCAGNAL